MTFRWSILSLLSVCLLLPAWLFGQTSAPKGKRQLSSGGYYTQSDVQKPKMHTIRIAEGNLWINGNLQAKQDLPSSLQTINPYYLFEARLFGADELKFSLFGRDYLLKKGQLIEIPDVQYAGNAMTVSADREGYYESTKNTAPGLFEGWQKEARLHQEAVQLLVEYEMSSGQEKEMLERELETKLSQLFDITIANQEAEIRQAEKELDALRKQLEFRKKNKKVIVENRMKEITGE